LGRRPSLFSPLSSGLDPLHLPPHANPSFTIQPFPLSTNLSNSAPHSPSCCTKVSQGLCNFGAHYVSTPCLIKRSYSPCACFDFSNLYIDR
jgi:hypothetical protein